MIWNKLYFLRIIYLVLIINTSQAKNVQKRGVIDNLNDGLKMAGQMFGINTAADVANLVAKAFSNNNNNNNRNKPDLFAIIQKGLQSSLSKNSDETKYSEKQQTSETNESGQQQTDESTQFKQFKTPSSTSTPAKENVGVNFGTANLITSMLRMVGFDASKLGALAINALIMIASAIGNTLMSATTSQTVVSSLDGGRLFHKNPKSPHSVNEEEDEQYNAETGPEEQYSPSDHQPRLLTDDSPVDWFLQNPSKKIKRILKEATHTNLADKLTNMIASYETKQGEGACLKMLVCKSSPFIWGMQKSLKKSINMNLKEAAQTTKAKDLNESSDNALFNVNSFFTHLPSINEYREHGEKCEQLFSTHCNTSDLYDKEKH